MLAKDIKPGSIVVSDGAPCIIENVTVQSPSARGGATIYKFRARNLVTKNKIDLNLKGTEGLEDADFQKREVTVMYADTESVHLMDTETYEQYAIALADVENEMKFVREGFEGLLALIYNGECVGVTLPAMVELKITQCDPGVKGNSATGRTKPLQMETGLQIHGPEYLKEGEIVKVDTRTSEFLGRA
ncbi:elongation factor P [Botrimarina hoheduenensis]|uniref:Elongation factor P-like protein n=1 Tax=Botrimarina hoheduenensis TaxID=2528000 RepID=A0A5C5WCD1_9BACT|nr:translation elongation factor EF-P [Botrimarina hoheduenensis]TWT48330.1 Elongation factor P-like protein [Botrimarina hoheduenensis]